MLAIVNGRPSRLDRPSSRGTGKSSVPRDLRSVATRWLGTPPGYNPLDTGTGIPSDYNLRFSQGGDSRKLYLSGMDSLIKKMAELPQKLRTKIGKNAADIAANIILQAVLARTPVKTGKLKSGIKKQAARVRHGVGRLVALPERSVLGISPSDLYYWPAALEYGHASPGFGVYSSLTKKRVRRTGLKHIPSWSFLRSGFDAVEKIAGAQLIRSIDTALAQEFARP